MTRKTLTFVFIFVSSLSQAKTVETKLSCDVTSSSLFPVFIEKDSRCTQYSRELGVDYPYSIETCVLKTGEKLDAYVSNCSIFAPLKMKFVISSSLKSLTAKKILELAPLTGNYFKLNQLETDPSGLVKSIQKGNSSLQEAVERKTFGKTELFLNQVRNESEIKAALVKHLQLRPEDRAKNVYFDGVHSASGNHKIFSFLNFQKPCLNPERYLAPTYAERTWNEISLSKSPLVAKKLNEKIRKTITVGKVLYEKCEMPIESKEESNVNISGYTNGSSIVLRRGLIGISYSISFGDSHGNLHMDCSIYSKKDGRDLGSLLKKNPNSSQIFKKIMGNDYYAGVEDYPICLEEEISENDKSVVAQVSFSRYSTGRLRENVPLTLEDLKNIFVKNAVLDELIQGLALETY